MIWLVGGCLVLGLGLCGTAWIAHQLSEYEVDSAAPLYLMVGTVLISASIVLAIGNAAVQALL